MLGRQRLFVNSVPGLVQNAEERLVEEPRIVPRRDTAVARADAGAERVCRRVEPAGVEVETDGGRRRAAERLLLVGRKLAGEDVAVGAASGRGDPLYEGDQVLGERREELGDLGRGRPWFVFVEQGVV